MLSREDTNTAVKIPSKYGSKALEEIRMYQHSVNELIPKAPFKRLVRELVADTQVVSTVLTLTYSLIRMNQLC